MNDVRETHWADRDRRNFERIAEHLPAVLETVHDDWQHRVDTPENARAHYERRHVYLRVITAQRSDVQVTERYPNGIVTPVGERKTYLVAADTLTDAWDTVKGYLEAERPGETWSYLHAPQDAQTLVLDGRRAR